MSLRRSLAALPRSASIQPRNLRIPRCLPRLSPRRPPWLPTTLQSTRLASTLPDRSSKFTRLTKEHISHLRTLVESPSSVMSTLDRSASEDDLKSYNVDWMNKYHGKSQVVVRPRTTDEVSQVVKWCHENDIAVVPQGGNTGLVGE